MNFYFLIILVAITRIFTNLFVKFWAMNQRPLFFALALIASLATIICFALAVKKSSLSLTTPLAAISVTIGSVLIGVFYFQEKLTAPQIFGVALAITAIFFLTFPFQILQK
ncbi:hypothetical protein KKF38_04255 [Patescibacteria group bacterium]|nr:hypothetical protein [Patescibacteria group bacterium]